MRYTLDKRVYKEHLGKKLFRVLDNGEPTRAYAAEDVTFSDECTIHDGYFHGGEFHGGVFCGGCPYKSKEAATSSTFLTGRTLKLVAKLVAPNSGVNTGKR